MTGGQGVQLFDSVRAIRRRWPLILVVTLIVLAVALAISLSSEKQYDASAELLFGGQDRAQNLLTPDTAAVQPDDPERQITTDVELIKRGTVPEAVRRRLRLDMTLDELRDKISTETSTTSDLVSLTARDPDPRQAARLANAFAEEYVSFRRRSSRKSLVDAARLADARLAALGPDERLTEEARELRARKRELDIAAALQTGGVEVVREASVPRDPSRPRPKFSAVAGGMLGLVLGIGLALALEFADRRLKDEDAIEREFELPVLAAIPPPPARRGGDDHLQREAYGLLAANVRLTTSSESKVVMVTSPSPGDGKTSVSLGPARALARLGTRVILIEADLRRPSVGRYAGLPQVSGGLSALLMNPDRHLAHEIIWLDAATMRPVTLDALKEGLSFAVLVAGPVPPNPQRLLARPEMTSVVETATSLADVVIIDTPPIGTVNDAATLSRLVDNVLVVARLNQTTKDAARRAMRVLRNMTVDTTGIAVTNAAVADQYAYYGIDSSAAPADDQSPVEGART